VSEIKRTLTFVIIEHDMRFLFRLAERINVIHWGQVIAQGTPDALRDEGNVVFLCVHPNEPFHLEILREACERYLFVNRGTVAELADFER
jgi:ABC-type multidrug transport system ATPase subunit